MKLPRYLKYKDSGVEWLGQVPEHWVMAKLGFRYQVALGKMLDEKRTTGNYLAPYLRNVDVQWKKINMEDLPVMDFDENDRVRFGLKEGDLLVCEGGDVGRAAILGKCNFDIFYQKALHRIRPYVASRDFPPFLFYQIFNASLQGRFTASENKSTIGHLPAEALRTYRFCFPSPAEQIRIATFLDGETGKIDALIAEQQRLIESLKEKRQAIISRAVTKGLKPDALMKSSGIDWIGDIPAHWDVERTRWLFTERDQRSETGEEEMLTVSHLTGVTPRSEKNVTMFEAETNEGYKLCQAGDLVINTLWAWMGAMGIAPICGMVSPAYNVYIPGKQLWPSYVDSLVRMPLFAQEITRYSKGVWTSRLRLYPEGLYRAYFPVPPLDEQKAIAQHIADESARIESLTIAANKSIELLQERRATLVSNAVTGQIDVRNCRPEEAAAVCQ